MLDELSKRTGRLVLTLRVLDFLDYRVVNPFRSSKEKEGERIAKEVSTATHARLYSFTISHMHCSALEMCAPSSSDLR